MPQLTEEYIKTGKLKYVFRDLPLESIHPQAFKAAEAANCAGEQGKYWEMNHRLFENPRALAVSNMPAHAQAVGLDVAKFTQCLEGGKQAAEIRKDMADAAVANILGTPNFVIGIVNAKNPRDPRVRVFKNFVGAQPYAVFKSVIDAALAEAARQ